MIYLDNAATTKPYKEVVEVITNVLNDDWGNASSSYKFGKNSKEIIENVREQIAEDINCDPDEIIFTSSGCEANSLALSNIPDGYELFTTRLEHPSILNAVFKMKNAHFINNDEFGNITVEALTKILRRNKIYGFSHPFVSICGANSEIGTIQNIEAFGEIIHRYDGIFHCDATALYPHQKIDVKKCGIDMMTVSAQKFHATEGVGFLYVKNGMKINPIIYGNQENELRGGSYNTALIAGMGKALEVTRTKKSDDYCKHLRNMMLDDLLKIPGVKLNGPSIDENRLNGNINITIDGVDSSVLLGLCDMHDICISKGSACHSYNKIPSTTLKAIGLTDEQASQTIRITIDMFNTYEEVLKAVKTITWLINDIKHS